MLRYDRVKWRDLTSRDREAWRDFRAADPGLRSPYFDLAWHDAVDRARGDLMVLKVFRRDAPAGFLPFHPGLLGTSRPSGGTFCDWQGFVAAPDIEIDARSALAAGPATFHFAATPPGDRGFGSLAEATGASHLMDISKGWDAYARPPKGRAAPKAVANFRRATRKLEADGRTVEVVTRDSRPETLNALIALKSEQYRRTGYGDLFAWGWTRRLVHELAGRRFDDFEAVLSSLWIDGTLAAAHLGLRSGGVLHHWLPAFDRNLASYAPGHLLTVEVARALADEGVAEIDLGVGEVAWKKEFANAEAPLIRGVAHARSPQGRCNAAAYALGRYWATLPLGPAARLHHGLSWRLDRRMGRFAQAPAGLASPGREVPTARRWDPAGIQAPR